MQISSLYLTKAQDFTEQADFYNMAVSGFFNGTPRDLLEQIREIEIAYGRDRVHSVSGGPRTLDIDIELFGNFIVQDSDLVIPHERMNNRQFVLIPLLEIDCSCINPKTGEHFKDILSRLSGQGVKKAGNLYEN